MVLVAEYLEILQYLVTLEGYAKDRSWEWTYEKQVYVGGKGRGHVARLTLG